MKVLIIRQSSLGDVLHATSVIRRIKQVYPYSHITFLTDRSASPIVANNPFIDRCVVVDISKFVDGGSLWKLVVGVNTFGKALWRVNGEVYDLAIDLQGLGRTLMFIYLCRAKVRLARAWWGFGFIRRYWNAEVHAIREMHGVLELGGIGIKEPLSSMGFYLTEREVAYGRRVVNGIRRLAGEGRKVVVMSPFTSWESKSWELCRVRELVGILSGCVYLIITGHAGERGRMGMWLDLVGQGKCYNGVGEWSIRELGSVVKAVDGVVACDTFLLHMGVALGKPLVGLFGPTSMGRAGPMGPMCPKGSKECSKGHYGEGVRYHLIRSPGCGVCFKRRCNRRCMGRITALRVAEATRLILGMKD